MKGTAAMDLCLIKSASSVLRPSSPLMYREDDSTVLVLMSMETTHIFLLTYPNQGFFSRPVDPNRRPPVPVYRTGWTGNRFIPVKFKIEFKFPRRSGSNRYTGRLDRFTGRFGRYTGDLDGPVPSGIPAGLAGIPVVSSSFPTLKKWIPGVK